MIATTEKNNYLVELFEENDDYIVKVFHILLDRQLVKEQNFSVFRNAIDYFDKIIEYAEMGETIEFL
jgi:hypothetical protein